MASALNITADEAEITDGAGIATTPTTGGTYAPGATGGVVVSDSGIGAGRPGGGDSFDDDGPQNAAETGNQTAGGLTAGASNAPVTPSRAATTRGLP